MSAAVALDAVRTTLARGGPLLLCIHAWTALLALGTTASLRDALAVALSTHGSGPVLTPGDVALVLEVIARQGAPTLRAAWPTLLAVALLSPALTVALSHALATSAGMLASLRTGASRAIGAAAVRIFACLLFAAGAAVLTLSFGFVLGRAPELIELPLQLAYLALLGLHALGCATIHDLALARLALRSPRLSRALMVALLRTTPQALAWRGVAASASLALIALADLCSRTAWPLPQGLSSTFGGALAQCCLFAALVSRALFLLYVVRPQPSGTRSTSSIAPEAPQTVSQPPP
jgi:hypothetical protein